MEIVAFESLDIAVPAFHIAARLAVEAGLEAAAIVDAKGKTLALAGALTVDEARAVAAFATHAMWTHDLRERTLAGELLTTTLGTRDVRIGIAAGYVFFIIVCAPHEPSITAAAAIDALLADIVEMVADARSNVCTTPPSPPPPPATSGSSGSSGSSTPAHCLRD